MKLPDELTDMLGHQELARGIRMAAPVRQETSIYRFPALVGTWPISEATA
jgi:hypothetical protein